VPAGYMPLQALQQVAGLSAAANEIPHPLIFSPITYSYFSYHSIRGMFYTINKKRVALDSDSLK